MPAHQGQTDKTTKVTLTSAIEHAGWTEQIAAPGGLVGLEVFCSYVGNGAELQIELADGTGKKLGSFKDVISGSRFWAPVRVPQNAKDTLEATVKLPKHGLSATTAPLHLLPAVEITNLKWDKQEARRGDVLKLTADVKGAPDGTEAMINILEHDSDGAHDPITNFPATVKNRKIETSWEYEYQEDTDEIPTKEEAAKGYNPPEYFFRVSVGGVTADSGLLLFKDWIEIDLKDQAGKPIPDQDYELKLPDGSTRKGKLDAKGTAREKDIPPGPYEVVFPNL